MGSETAFRYMENTATWAIGTIGTNLALNSSGTSTGSRTMSAANMGDTMSSDTSIWRFTVRLS